MATGDQLMTLSQAAEKCACSPKTIRRAVDAGQLSACRLGESARSDRIHPADLALWWGKCKVRVCPSPSVRMDITKLPLVSAEEQLANLLGIGRSKMPRTTSGKCSQKSVKLRLVENRTGP